MSKRLLFIIVGASIGALGGFLYYYFIGCTSGSCSITSKPLNSTVYGVAMGGLVADVFHDKSRKPKKTNENETDQ